MANNKDKTAEKSKGQPDQAADRLDEGRVDEGQVDPVCGMEVDPGEDSVEKSDYQGTTYFFCSEGCRQDFETNPKEYVE